MRICVWSRAVNMVGHLPARERFYITLLIFLHKGEQEYLIYIRRGKDIGPSGLHRDDSDF
jgi:hypothetical protein